MSVFISPRLKVERAYKLIQEIKKVISPLSKELYEIKVEEKYSFPIPCVIERDLIYKPKKPIAETLGLIIGDVISNFRSALDHLASGIVREKDEAKRPYFAMSESREELSRNRHLSTLNSALPGSTELLLDKIRHQGKEDDIYWSFYLMDNDSKHNVILPTVSAVSIQKINLVCGNVRLKDCAVTGDATKQIVIFRTDGAKITFQDTLDLLIMLNFPAESIFPNLPVIHTLEKIGEIVSNTIDEFEQLYISHKNNK